jgi:hypothetical protein
MAAWRPRWLLVLGCFVLVGAKCGARDPYPCSLPFDAQQGLFVETPAARMVFQRNAQNRGDIVVSGSYDVSLAGVAPIAIAARWGGGQWALVDLNPREGRFAGVLPNQDATRGRQPLEVRFANAASVSAVVPDVGIGDLLLVTGQSNAVQWFGTLSASQSGASAYPLFVHPRDPQRVKWAADPLHACLPLFGSMYPALLDRVTARTGVPIMFVAGAVSGQSIEALDDGTGLALLERQLSAATAGQLCPRLVLFLHGETDASAGMPAAEYVARFQALYDALQADLWCDLNVVVGVIGSIELDGHATPANAEAIRDALRSLPGTRPGIFAGPETVDLPLADGLHFGDTAGPALLERWCEAIDASGVLPCD